MNVMAGFIGYSAFVLSVLAIAGLAYCYADDLERRATRKLEKNSVIKSDE